MDFADIKNKSVKELQEILGEKRALLRELRFKVGEKQLKNFGQIKSAKKTVAHVLTLLNNRRQSVAKKG